MTDFDSFGLHPELVQAVAERGYQVPTPIQEAVIPLLLSGEDVMGQAQTGTGKTAAFALPMLHNLVPGQKHVQALVVAPTRELAVQVHDAIKAYGQFAHVRVVAVYGGAAYGPQIAALKRGVDVVVGTPGRLMDLMRKNVLDLNQVGLVVLDEADEMLSMGFAEDIETILSSTPEVRQTALFSATLPPEIRSLAGRYLHKPHAVTIQREQVTGVGIEQRVYFVHQAEKTAAVTRLFEMEEIHSALIFVRTRAASSELANQLSGRGFPAEALNGDLNQETRERTLGRFREGKIKVLVATDVAARGLDIDDISHVFNYDLPDDPELYVHRIGRTGRAGKTGVAITLAAPYEKRMLYAVESFARQKLVRTSIPSEESIRQKRDGQLQQQIMVWLLRGRCKHEREIVDALVEQGHDPLDVAAAALKVSRADEKQRPIEFVAELVEERPAERGMRRAAPGTHRERFDRPMRGGRAGEAPRGEREERQPRRSGPRPVADTHRTADEPGMVRLSMGIGKHHGVRPNDVVGVIAAHANIPGSSIGKISILERRTLVDVPEAYVAQVLKMARQAEIRRRPIELEMA